MYQDIEISEQPSKNGRVKDTETVLRNCNLGKILGHFVKIMYHKASKKSVEKC